MPSEFVCDLRLSFRSDPYRPRSTPLVSQSLWSLESNKMTAWRLSAGVVVVARPRPPAPSAGAAAGKFKVLLVKRSGKSRFMPNIYVFPGGKVDAECDQTAKFNHLNAKDEYNGPATRFRNEMFMLAAARELYEEAGILVGRHGRNSGVETGGGSGGSATWTKSLPTPQQVRQEPRLWREVVLPAVVRARSSSPSSAAGQTAETPANASASGFEHLPPAIYKLLREELSYICTFITPDVETERQVQQGRFGFDTPFYLHAVESNSIFSTAQTDDKEVFDLLWISPGEAIRKAKKNELHVGPPQWYLLKHLAHFESMMAEAEDAGGNPEVELASRPGDADDAASADHANLHSASFEKTGHYGGFLPGIREYMGGGNHLWQRCVMKPMPVAPESYPERDDGHGGGDGKGKKTHPKLLFPTTFPGDELHPVFAGKKGMRHRMSFSAPLGGMYKDHKGSKDGKTPPAPVPFTNEGYECNFDMWDSQTISEVGGIAKPSDGGAVVLGKL